MSFIAKNPLSSPEIESNPSPPPHGTRGIFPKCDGWYEITDKGDARRFVNTEDLSNYPTKSEIDSKFGYVYRFCGSTTVNESNNMLTTPIGGRVGDVYNVASGGNVYQSADVLIDIDSVSVDDLGRNNMLLSGEDTNIFAIVASDPNCKIYIGEEGSDISDSKAILTDITVGWIAGTLYTDLYFKFHEESPIQEIDISKINIWKTWKIIHVNCSMVVEAGDNVVCVGTFWDKLSASVDISKFATKEEIENQFEYVYTKTDIDDKFENVYTKDDVEIGNIVQDTGESKISVMSQKAITDELNLFRVSGEKIVKTGTNIFNPELVILNKAIDVNGNIVDSTDGSLISQIFKVKSGETAITISYVTGGGVHQLSNHNTTFYSNFQ